ncbi:MAG: trigger factor [Clostridiaceae bacterium]|jgi:trigger factor|nr:trigger factor [Clostridiaceae bacterium]
MASEKISEEKQTITLEITVEPDIFKRSLQAAHRKNARYFQVPGFRKGKAPYPIVVNYYGEDVLYDDALNDALPKAYEAALEEQDIDVRSMPRFDIKTISGKEGLVFEAQVAIKPDVKLGQYEGVVAYRPDVTVEDQEIDARIEAARERVSRLVPVTDRPIKEGDSVTFDYEGLLDGEPFQGGSNEGHVLEIGSGAFIPGFEDGLIGHNVGDEFELPLTFPEEYHAEDLAGQDVVFNVKIHEIRVKELPALDDEFVHDVSESADTVDEYREEIRQEILKQKNSQADTVFEDNILDAIVKDAELSYSDLMVEDDIDQMIENQERQFAMYNLKFSDFLQYSGQTMYDFRKRQEVTSRKRIERACVLEAIRRAHEDQFKLGDELFEEEIAKAADEAGVSIDVFNNDYLKDDAQREDFRLRIEMQNLLEWLRSVSIATDVMPEIEDHEEDEAQGADELKDSDDRAQDAASDSEVDGAKSKDNVEGEE